MGPKGASRTLEHPGDNGVPPAGAAAPEGEAAVGRPLAVYWQTDRAFYPATCVPHVYRPDGATHTVLYADGETERLSLRSEAVKWLAPPVRPLVFHPLGWP